MENLFYAADSCGQYENEKIPFDNIEFSVNGKTTSSLSGTVFKCRQFEFSLSFLEEYSFGSVSIVFDFMQENSEENHSAHQDHSFHFPIISLRSLDARKPILENASDNISVQKFANIPHQFSSLFNSPYQITRGCILPSHPSIVNWKRAGMLITEHQLNLCNELCEGYRIFAIQLDPDPDVFPRYYRCLCGDRVLEDSDSGGKIEKISRCNLNHPETSKETPSVILFQKDLDVSYFNAVLKTFSNQSDHIKTHNPLYLFTWDLKASKPASYLHFDLRGITSKQVRIQRVEINLQITDADKIGREITIKIEKYGNEVIEAPQIHFNRTKLRLLVEKNFYSKILAEENSRKWIIARAPLISGKISGIEWVIVNSGDDYVDDGPIISTHVAEPGENNFEMRESKRMRLSYEGNRIVLFLEQK